MTSFAIKPSGIRGLPAGTMLGNNSGSAAAATTMDVASIQSMLGIPGGNPFDQSLNTTDSPSFVDGEFSGRVLTDRLENVAGYSYFRVGAGTAGAIRSWRNFEPQSNDSFNFGNITLRWANNYNVNGSFSNNLNVETGGSFKLFNLGDSHTNTTDTEYGFIEWDTNVLKFGVGADGTGSTSRPISFYTDSSFGFKNTGGSTRFNISTSNVTTYLDFQPSTDNAYDCGDVTKQWANLYAVNCKLSGIVESEYYTGTEGSTVNASVWLRTGTGFGYLTAVGAGSCFRWGGADLLSFKNVIPQYATIDIGRDNARWQKYYGLDASFTGTLATEVGGSFKLFNLGDSHTNTTDTEYLETSFESNVATIATKKTGAGADRSLTITSDGTTKLVGTYTRIYAGANLSINCYGTLSQFGSSLQPSSDNTRYCGSPSLRWSSVASVDADISGTLTTDLIQGGQSQIKLNEAASQFLNIWNAAGSIQYFSFRSNAFLPKASSIQLGLPVSTARWLNVHAVGGSYQNLNVETGGSFKLFNLGDSHTNTTDTEYLNIAWDTNECVIQPKYTGAGTYRGLRLEAALASRGYISVNSTGSVGIGYGAANHIQVQSGETRISVKVVPSTTNSFPLGEDARRWLNVASVNGDFSGTVTADTIDSAGNLFSMNNQGVEFFKNQWGLNNFYHTIQSNNTSGYALQTTKALRIGADSGAGYGYSAGNLNKTTLASAFETWFLISAPALSGNWYRFEKDSTGFKFSFNGTSGNEDIYSCNDTTKAISILRGGTSSWSNVDVEVGGSNRIFKLGSDADVAAGNSEYLETSWDNSTNTAKIQTKATGTGVGRKLDLLAGVTGVKAYYNSTLLLSSAWSTISMNNAYVNLSAPPSGYVSIRSGDLRPWDAVTPINCGQPAVPWAGVYSVKFDAAATWNDAATTFDLITGDITDTASDAESSLLNLKVGGTSYFRLRKDGDLLFEKYGGSARIKQNTGGIAILGDNGSTVQSFDQYFNYTYKTFRGIVDNQHLGYATVRFLLKANDIYSKGKIRSYNLGDETAVDAEYLNLHWLSGHAYLTCEATGTGVAREFSIGTHTNGSIRFNDGTNTVRFSVAGATATKMYLNSSGLTLYGVMAPQGDLTRDIGTPTARWRRTHTGVVNQQTNSTGDPSTSEYANDGDFGVHENTTSGAVFIVANVGGTIYKQALTS